MGLKLLTLLQNYLINSVVLIQRNKIDHLIENLKSTFSVAL
jgi:hypothetical protein